MRKTLSLAVLVLLACTFAGCARQDARAAYLKGCDALEAGSYEEAAAHFGLSLDVYMVKCSKLGISCRRCTAAKASRR